MWVQEDPLEEEIATHSSFLPGDSHGQRSLAGYSPEGHKESDRTEGTQHIPTWEIRSITDDFIQMTKNKARILISSKYSKLVRGGGWGSRKCMINYYLKTPTV